MIGLVCNDRYLHLPRTIFLIGPRDSLYVRICTPGVADVGLSRLLGLVAVASLLKRHGASCGDLRVNSMSKDMQLHYATMSLVERLDQARVTCMI